MALDDIVNVTISKQGVNLTQAGFGNLALLASHTFWTDRVRKFGSDILDALVALTVPVTHPIYLMAAAARAQNPAIKDFYVLKRTRLPTQVVKFTLVAVPVEGDEFSVTVDGSTYSAVAGASPSIASVCAAMGALIDAALDSTGTHTSTDFTFNGTTPGVLHQITDVSPNLAVSDVTIDPVGAGGIAGDLADAQDVDGSWYGLQIDTQSSASILAAAAWVESNKKLFVPSSSDAGCKDGASTTDVAYLLKNANYARTALIFHPDPQHYMGARWMGKQFPKDPGSTNWAHQQVVANAYKLSASETAALTAKKCNFFVTTNGVSTTFWGSLAGGEWIDVTHFIDWMSARTQERYFALLVGLEKLPYTQAGIEAAKAELRAQFYEGVQAGGIDGASPIVIDGPLITDVSDADKAARNLQGIRGSGRLAGAVNKVSLTITLTL